MGLVAAGIQDAEAKGRAAAAQILAERQAEAEQRAAASRQTEAERQEEAERQAEERRAAAERKAAAQRQAETRGAAEAQRHAEGRTGTLDDCVSIRVGPLTPLDATPDATWNWRIWSDDPVKRVGLRITEGQRLGPPEDVILLFQLELKTFGRCVKKVAGTRLDLFLFENGELLEAVPVWRWDRGYEFEKGPGFMVPFWVRVEQEATKPCEGVEGVGVTPGQLCGVMIARNIYKDAAVYEIGISAQVCLSDEIRSHKYDYADNDRLCGIGNPGSYSDMTPADPPPTPW